MKDFSCMETITSACDRIDLKLHHIVTSSYQHHLLIKKTERTKTKVALAHLRLGIFKIGHSLQNTKNIADPDQCCAKFTHLTFQLEIGAPSAVPSVQVVVVVVVVGGLSKSTLAWYWVGGSPSPVPLHSLAIQANHLTADNCQRHHFEHTTKVLYCLSTHHNPKGDKCRWQAITASPV